MQHRVIGGLGRMFAAAMAAGLFAQQAFSGSAPGDPDGDGIDTAFDNCSETANPDQRDTDCDRYGNACDADLNNSGGPVNFADLALFRASFGAPVHVGLPSGNADLNGSGGSVNFADLALFRALFGRPPGPTGAQVPVVTDCPGVTVRLLASSPQLGSDVTGGNMAALIALVRDGQDVPVAGVPIGFATISGSLTVTQPTTDELGRAIAALSNGTNPANRPVAVAARLGDVTGRVVIDVVGTTLAMTGPPSLAPGDTGTYQAVLRDSLGVGIGGREMSVSSAAGNTVSPSAIVTDPLGVASFDLTATSAGADVLSLQALGATTTLPLVVSHDLFRLTAPAAHAEIPVGTAQNVTAQWTIAGVPQNGETINFSSTRGTLSASSAVTAGAGTATVTIGSNNAGTAIISVTNEQDATATVTVEFVATDAETLDLQAAPATVATGGESDLIAIVRDPAGYPVKNEAVQFILTDITGGALSVGSGITDSHGRVQTIYTGGNTPSAINAVSIQAVVQGELTSGGAAVEDTVQLTVAPREVDMALATGDELHQPTPSLYAKEWAVMVTDSVGNPVASTNVQVGIRSVRYHKGVMALTTSGGDTDWAPRYDEIDGVLPNGTGCHDEDVDVDGFLSAAEDDPVGGTGFGNGNGILDAGNRATVIGIAAHAPEDACGSASAIGGSSVTNVITNSGGSARICVVYPRSDNAWVDVELAAQLSVLGTEFTRSQQFTLEALAADMGDEQSSPDGQVSPFGQAASCRDPD
jgi:hypothetical protein